jgi:predicted HNH restriction endonuclease
MWTEEKEVMEERKFPTEAIKHIITNKDPLKHIIYSKRTIRDLDLKECPICQQKTSKHNPIEMHHLNALKRDRNTNYRELIAALNAKQIPACRACHKKIHSGRYSGENLREIYQNLPKVTSD